MCMRYAKLLMILIIVVVEFGSPFIVEKSSLNYATLHIFLLQLASCGFL